MRTTLMLTLLIPVLLAGQGAQAPSRIVVLDGATGQPSANATVWIVDRRHASRYVARDPFVDDATYLATVGIAPRAGSLAFPQLLLTHVAAELRPRPMRVWLPKGEFTATAQIGAVTSAAIAIAGDTVTITLPK